MTCTVKLFKKVLIKKEEEEEKKKIKDAVWVFFSLKTLLLHSNPGDMRSPFFEMKPQGSSWQTVALSLAAVIFPSVT